MNFQINQRFEFCFILMLVVVTIRAQNTTISTEFDTTDTTMATTTVKVENKTDFFDNLCKNPPAWVTALTGVGPLIETVIGVVHFFILCCTDRYWELFQEMMIAFSLLNWFVFWSSVLYFLINCSKTGFDYTEFTTTKWLLLFTILVAYFIIMVECYISNDRQYIKNYDSAKSVRGNIIDLQNGQPKIEWTTFSYKYKKDVPFCSKFSPCCKDCLPWPCPAVVDEDRPKEYLYKYWVDHSPPLDEGIANTGVTRIKLDKRIRAGDTDTEQEFQGKLDESVKEMKESVQESQDEDKIRVKVRKGDDIDGFKPRLTAYVDHSAKSCWIGEPQFWIASALTLTWLYRLAFRCATAKANYVLMKRIYQSKPEGDDVRRYEVRKYGEIVDNPACTEEVEYTRRASTNKLIEVDA